MDSEGYDWIGGHKNSVDHHTSADNDHKHWQCDD